MGGADTASETLSARGHRGAGGGFANSRRYREFEGAHLIPLVAVITLFFHGALFPAMTAMVPRLSDLGRDMR